MIGFATGSGGVPSGTIAALSYAAPKIKPNSFRNSGRTVFFTSHALADVAEMCDRLAVLHAGRLRFAGTPAEMMARHEARDLEQAFLACIAS